MSETERIRELERRLAVVTELLHEVISFCVPPEATRVHRLMCAIDQVPHGRTAIGPLVTCARTPPRSPPPAQLPPERREPAQHPSPTSSASLFAADRSVSGAIHAAVNRYYEEIGRLRDIKGGKFP